MLKDYVLYYFKNESLATDPKNALGRFPIPSYEVQKGAVPGPVSVPVSRVCLCARMADPGGGVHDE